MDVIISSGCACRHPSFIAETRGRLGQWYGKHRIVRFDLHLPLRTQAQSSLRTLRNVQEHLRASSRRYRSVLLWRMDMVLVHPIATGGGFSAPTGANLPLTRAAIRLMMLNNASAGLYPIWGREFIASYAGDALLSLPGWALTCALPKLIECCGGDGSTGAGHEDMCFALFDSRNPSAHGNFCEHAFVLQQAAVWREQRSSRADPADAGVLSILEKTWANALAFRAPVIYRGPFVAKPFAGGAVRTCNLLHARFGGPACDAGPVLAQGCEALASISSVLAGKQVVGEALDSALADWMRVLQDALITAKHTPRTCIAGRDPHPDMTTPRWPVINEENHEAEACAVGPFNDCTYKDDPWMYVDVLTEAAAHATYGERCNNHLVTDQAINGTRHVRHLIAHGGPNLCKRLRTQR